MVLGGVAGILRWSLAGALTWLPFIAALQLLHALTFGASHLGAMHFLSRAVPPSAAASAQSLYAALSSGIGSGLVMVVAGALYAAYGGGAYSFMAVLSAAGLVGCCCPMTEPPLLAEERWTLRAARFPQPPCATDCPSAMPVPPPAWRSYAFILASVTSSISDGCRLPHGRPRNREMLWCRACWPTSASRSTAGKIARSE